jgi:hypothetical protein
MHKGTSQMKKLCLASVALVAFSGVALAGSTSYNGHSESNQNHGQQTGHQAPASPFQNTGTVSGEFELSHTTSVVNTQTSQTAWDNYQGFQGFAKSEHGGLVQTSTNGKGFGVGASLNYGVSSFNGAQGGGVGSGQALGTSSQAVSGSLAVGGSIGAGSSRVDTAGMASASSGARNEWGSSVTNTNQQSSVGNTTWQGSGSYTRAQ